MDFYIAFPNLEWQGQGGHPNIMLTNWGSLGRGGNILASRLQIKCLGGLGTLTNSEVRGRGGCTST